MAEPKEIILNNDPNYTFTTELEGVSTTINIRYYENQYIDVKGEKQDPYFNIKIQNELLPKINPDDLVGTITTKLVANFPLLKFFSLENFGELVLSTETRNEPDLSNLKDDFQLLYFSVEQKEELKEQQEDSI